MISWHIQNPPRDWPLSLPYLPDGTAIKAVNDYQILKEAKIKKPTMRTVFRMWAEDLYFNNFFFDNREEVANWYFNRFIDGTWWREEMHLYVDYIEGFNEIYANSHTPEETRARVLWEEAISKVWWERRQADARLKDIRLVIGNAAVGNDMPVDLARIATQYDCVVGYHPYIYTEKGTQPEWEWANLSGRWDLMDMEWQQAGYDVDWFFGETGPYNSAVTGWRSTEVCGSDILCYVDSVKYWLDHAIQTPAYHEDRIVGATLFTSSNDSTWKYFQTGQPEMNEIAIFVGDYPFPPKKGEVDPPPPPEPDPATPSFVIDYVDALPSDTTSDYYPYATRPLSQIENIIVHHSVGLPTNPPESINIGHQNRGWPRIGYHFYVNLDANGNAQVYKVNNLTTHSYHAGEANATSIGICLAGDFTNTHPTQGQLTKTNRLIQWLNDVLGEKSLLKHLDVSATQCPGNTWAEWWDELSISSEPSVNYVVVANLLPQNATKTQVQYALEQTYPQKQTIVYSADDAARLVAPGLPGSKVVVWNPSAWADSITEWLVQRGVQLVEVEEFPSPNLPDAGTFDFPVGTEEERAAARLDWPGNWTDANPYGNKYLLGGSYSFHTGSDLNCNRPSWDLDRGQPVYAIADGVVTYSDRYNNAWGNIIVIRHPLPDGENVYSRYSAIVPSVRQNQIVSKGDKIGIVDRHYEGQPYHLHFDISPTERLAEDPGDWPGLTWSRIERDYTDPLQFILNRKGQD